MRNPIYRLFTDCNKDLGLRTDLDYFQSHFIGKPMAANWKPPAVRILGKSKRLRDFVAWMLKAPVISEKAKNALQPLIAPHAEILPLIELRGKMFFAVNVTTLVACLDKEKSDILYAPDEPGRILNISRYFFNESRVKPVPIFKLLEFPIDVFVTRPFVDAVISNGLRGAAFGDPSVSPFDAILAGRSHNVVPGVPE